MGKRLESQKVDSKIAKNIADRGGMTKFSLLFTSGTWFTLAEMQWFPFSSKKGTCKHCKTWPFLDTLDDSLHKMNIYKIPFQWYDLKNIFALYL